MNDVKLTEVFVKNGMPFDSASKLAKELYADNEKVMFRAILWGFAKFGNRATYNKTVIEHIMAEGKLNEFQAMAKYVHTQPKD